MEGIISTPRTMIFTSESNNDEGSVDENRPTLGNESRGRPSSPLVLENDIEGDAGYRTAQKCWHCIKDKKKCTWNDGRTRCHRCEKYDYDCSADANTISTIPAPKRRKLVFVKCWQCRKDKKKCTPTERDWPRQKCERCIHKGYPCSEGTETNQASIQSQTQKMPSAPTEPESSFTIHNNRSIESPNEAPLPLMKKPLAPFMEMTLDSLVHTGLKEEEIRLLATIATYDSPQIMHLFKEERKDELESILFTMRRIDQSALEIWLKKKFSRSTVLGPPSTTAPDQTSSASKHVSSLSQLIPGDLDHTPRPGIEDTVGQAVVDQPFEASRQSELETTSSGSNKRFACPFFKHHPDKDQNSRACVGPGFQDINRLKEHLQRSHGESSGQRTGSLVELPLSSWAQDMISVDQSSRIRSIQGRKKSREEHWEEIYQILFPGTRSIPSPYYGYESHFQQLHDDENIAIRAYQAYLRHELPNTFMKKLKASGIFQPWQLQEGNHIIVNIVQECHEELSRQYEKRSEGAVGPGSEPLVHRQQVQYISSDDDSELSVSGDESAQTSHMHSPLSFNVIGHYEPGYLGFGDIFGLSKADNESSKAPSTQSPLSPRLECPEPSTVDAGGLSSVVVQSSTAYRGEVAPLRKYLCTICRKYFATRSNLRRHYRTFHTVGKADLKRQCREPNCGRVFSRPDALVAHMEKLHKK